MNKLRYNVSFWLGALFLFVTGGMFGLFRCTSEITGARRRTFLYGRRFQRPVDRVYKEIGFDLFVWAGNDLRVSRSLDTKIMIWQQEASIMRQAFTIMRIRR